MTQWVGENGPPYAPEPAVVPYLSDLCPSTRLTMLEMPFEYAEPPSNPVPWSWLNPSIADRDGQLYATVRASNFTIGESGEYLIQGDGQTIRTCNWFCSLRDDLSVQGYSPLPQHPLGPDRHPAAVDGCEDLRLIRVNGRWLATCAVWDRGPGTAEQGLWDLAGGDIEMLHSPEPGPQKNWMPFVADDQLHLLYRIEPCIVLKVDQGTVIAGWSSAQQPMLSFLRGGSQGIEVNGRWLFVAHEACLQPRTYSQCLVWLTREHGAWEIDGTSELFRFTSDPVEFCCGLARHGSDAILSFGIGERAGAFARVPLAELEAMRNH